MTTDTVRRDGSADKTEVCLHRLIRLRRQLLSELTDAASPALARSLEMADIYLFMALGYLGYIEELYPEEAIEVCGGAFREVESQSGGIS